MQKIQKVFDGVQKLEKDIEDKLALINPALLCFLTVTVLGILAHGYIIFHEAFTHDSLNALYADYEEDAWKIGLGRFVKPIYETLIRGDFAAPWLIGCLTLFWTGLALYLVVQMFEMKSMICIVLTGGMMITNLTVSSTAATFIHELDANMFAMLMAILASYRWKKNAGIDVIGILCIVISLGIYQSFISVSIVLMLMSCIMDILHEKRLRDVVYKGISACITLLLGAIVYICALWMAQRISGYSIDTGTYNSVKNINKDLFGSLVFKVKDICVYMREDIFNSWRCAFPSWAFKMMHLVLAGCAAGSIIRLSLTIKAAARNKLFFCIPLLLCIPFAIYFSTIVSNESIRHHLMLYGLWMAYVLVLLIVYYEPIGSQKRGAAALRLTVAAVFSLFIWGNIRAANSMYLIKGFQSEAALSYVSRIAYRMEEVDEYVAGRTRVALIGNSHLLQGYVPGTEYFTPINGMGANLYLRSPNHAYDPVSKLFSFKLNNPIILCDDDTYWKLVNSPEVAEMPSYPHNDCIKMIDGVLVVKF